MINRTGGKRGGSFSSSPLFWALRFYDVRAILYTEHMFDILSMPGVDP